MDITMNVTDPGGSEPRPPNPPPASAEAGVRPPKRIYRDPSGPIGGVAGGFAGYFDIDPVITRLLWIVALFSGIGLPAYLVCWLVIPKAKVWPAPGYARPVASSANQSSTTLLSGFVIIGLVAVVGSGVDGVGQYLLPAALIGFGVYLLNQRATSAAGEMGATSAAGSGSPGDSLAMAGARGEPAPIGFSSPAGSAHSAWREAPEAARGGLVTPTVLSVLAIAVGIIAALHAAGVVHVSIVTLAAAGLVIVGAGLVASLWLGRARGLVPTGLVLVAVLLGAAALGSWLDSSSPLSARDRVMGFLMAPGSLSASGASGGMGDRLYAPESLAKLEPSYELGAGELVVDLSRIDFTGQSRHVEIRIGMGEATVIVPAGPAVKVRGHVGIGEAVVFGRSHDGMGKNVREDDPGQGAGELEIQLQVGLGEGEVRRGAL
jgi:phage shock protein PspC (stress-responsive transcriptional regulator)